MHGCVHTHCSQPPTQRKPPVCLPDCCWSLPLRSASITDGLLLQTQNYPFAVYTGQIMCQWMGVNTFCFVFIGRSSRGIINWILLGIPTLLSGYRTTPVILGSISSCLSRGYNCPHCLNFVFLSEHFVVRCMSSYSHKLVDEDRWIRDPDTPKSLF